MGTDSAVAAVPALMWEGGLHDAIAVTIVDEDESRNYSEGG